MRCKECAQVDTQYCHGVSSGYLFKKSMIKKNYCT